MIKRIECGPRLSQAVVHGNLVYLAGQVAADLSGDVQAQAKQVLAKADQLLSEAGSDRIRLLSVMVWLPDIGDFARFNEIYDAWIPQGATPARACVESRLADPRIKVEIAMTAAI